MEYKIVTVDDFNQYMKDFSDLYYLCFKQPMSESEIIWRYLKNPNPGLFCCFAIDDGKLVANYSVSPIQVVLNGKIYDAVQSLNTMTHPDYKGRGLFVELAKTVYNYCAQKGYAGVIGFPNNVSNRTFVNKLNWSDVVALPTLVCNVADYSNVHLTTGDSIKLDNKFLYDYDDLYSKNNNSIYKSTKYLQWRYFENPTNEYKNFVIVNDNKVEAYMIIKKYKEDFYNIVDYYDNSDIKKFSSLYSNVKKFILENGGKYISIWEQLGTQEHLYLEKERFANSTPITYFGGSVFQNDIDENEYFCANKWKIDMCDDNVY